MYVCMYVYMYVCMYVYMYVYVCKSFLNTRCSHKKTNLKQDSHGKRSAANG